MALRPVFVPLIGGKKLVDTIMVEFEWFSGFAISQKQKSIESLHENIKNLKLMPTLEISTKSTTKVGQLLSAFNLKVKLHSGKESFVESVYQGSKKFEKGTFQDLYLKSAIESKKDERLRNSGKLIAYVLENDEWELNPQTAFYDWIYINAINQNPNLSKELLEYNSFTDIEFNPKVSINCQAHSAALYKSLFVNDLVEKVLKNKDSYLEIISGKTKSSTRDENGKSQLSFDEIFEFKS